MTSDDYAKGLLATLIFREARGDGADAMRAVAHVVDNRVKAWKGGWIHAMTFKNQFSSMTVLGNSQTVVWCADTDNLVFGIVEAIWSGNDPDNTFGALYYANEAVEKSPWYLQNIIQKPDLHPVLAVIGRQVFRK